jgi:hypothetical protein
LPLREVKQSTSRKKKKRREQLTNTTERCRSWGQDLTNKGKKKGKSYDLKYDK